MYAPKTYQRKTSKGGFVYPFGAYPERDYLQTSGYDSKYIRDEGCFYYQISLSQPGIEAAFVRLLSLLPERACLVVKLHSEDFYRDHDTYLGENLIDVDRIVRWAHDWRDVVFDDGFFGVGLFVEGDAREIFLDEHKTIHVYHTDPGLIESTLESLNIPFVFDLRFYWSSPHFHEPLPVRNDSGADYLTAFENLADFCELVLEEEEPDDDSLPTMICWKVDVRGISDRESTGIAVRGFYISLWLNASSRGEVHEVVEEYLGAREERIEMFLQIARTPMQALIKELREKNPHPDIPAVWLESNRVEFERGRR